MRFKWMLLAVLAVVAAGCGGGDDAAPTEGDATEVIGEAVEEATDAAEEAAGDDDEWFPEEVVGAGSVVTGDE